jgi:hypothetical protein
MSRKSKLVGSLGSAWLPLASLVLVVALAVPVAGSAQTGSTSPDTVPIPPAETFQEGPSLVPATEENAKVDSSLTQLLAAGQRGGRASAQAYADQHLLVVDDGQVQVEILTTEEAVPDLIEAIEAAGGEYQGHFQDLMQALLPLPAIESLATRSDVVFVREPARPVVDDTLALARNAEVAAETSQGVAASNADNWHAAGQTGQGTRVAVFDAGFAGYTALLGKELPNKVKTYDHSGGGMDGFTDHGTAVAEIVHDMAPDADISLHRVTTIIALSKAVDQAIADKADVISMSLSWNSGGPGDGTGTMADIVAKARKNGILFFKSAGNQATTTWSGTFVGRAVNSDIFHVWDGTTKWINFLGPGNGNCYLKPANSLILGNLHWDDWTERRQNYDLHLVRWTGGSQLTLVASSTNVQNGPGGPPPEEAVAYVVPSSGACYAWIVEKVKADRDVCFRLITPNSSLHLDEWTTERSLPFPADAPTIFAVAAVNTSMPYALEGYSSQGRTFGPGGTCKGGVIKPDGAAYANVDTDTYGPSGFPGTSASTPHFGGAAATVWGAYPGWSADVVQNFLETRAIDMGPAGKDTMYGWGRLHLGNPPVDYDYQIFLPIMTKVYQVP